MAEKKSAKTSVKAVAKDVAKTAEDLRKLSVMDLNEALVAAKSDLANARKMLAANELPNTNVVKKSRKFVAKIHTVLGEKLAESAAKVDKSVKSADAKVKKELAKGKEQK